MGKVTGISWTDHTFNPWWGCTKVSPGCDNCYAEAFDKRVGGSHWGKGEPRRTFGDKHWNEPLRWNAAAFKDGLQRKVFCASMADIMDDEAPEGLRNRLWRLIDSTPNLLWQLLTKRPQRYAKYLPQSFPLGNVILGMTGEDQPNYDLRAPITKEAARSRNLLWWVSYEPALGPLAMRCEYCEAFRPMAHGLDICGYPDWIVFGGESGAHRRECKTEWADHLLNQCLKTGTKFFMKQMGGLTPVEGKAAIPPELMIQEFPV